MHTQFGEPCIIVFLCYFIEREMYIGILES